METSRKLDLDQAILDSLPHWTMLVQASTRTVLNANRLARQDGAMVGKQCWDTFNHRKFIPKEQKVLLETNPGRARDSRISCWFCQADKCLAESKVVQREVKVEGAIWLITWVPVGEDIFLHYGMDITSMRQAEDAKLNAARLESAMQTAGAACHEMNQPLQAVSTMLELKIMELGRDDPLRGWCLTMQEQISRMGDVTRKMNRMIGFHTTDYLENGIKILDLDKSSSSRGNAA